MHMSKWITNCVVKEIIHLSTEPVAVEYIHMYHLGSGGNMWVTDRLLGATAGKASWNTYTLYITMFLGEETT